MTSGKISTEMTSERRSKLLGEAAGFLVTAGISMTQYATSRKDEPGTALGAVVQVAGDLARGLHSLHENRNYYAATALSRQLIETSDLVSYFNASPTRATFWLNATEDEVRKAADFQPKTLRRKARSSYKVYSDHCLLGGHPRTLARYLLPGSPWRRPGASIKLPTANGSTKADLKALLITDALQHTYETVLVTIEALNLDSFQVLGLTEDHTTQLIGKLVEDLVAWRKHDPLATAGPARME
jgi:hypothetical protein